MVLVTNSSSNGIQNLLHACFQVKCFTCIVTFKLTQKYYEIERYY